MENRSVQCDEGAVEVDREVIRCVRYEHARGIGLVQAQCPRRFPTEVNAGEQRGSFTQPISVEHVFRTHIAMFTLADQSVSEIRPHVESVVAVEPRKLELTVLGEMPHVVEDYGSVRRFFVLADINGIVRSWYINRYQTWLKSSAVISNAINREFVVAEVEYLRDVAFVLFAMLQSVEVAVAKGDLGTNPGSVRRIGRAPTGDK